MNEKQFGVQPQEPVVVRPSDEVISVRPTDDTPHVISRKVREAITQLRGGHPCVEVTGLSDYDLVNFRALLYKMAKARELRLITRCKQGVLYIMLDM